MKWKYGSENFAGNFHQAAAWLTEHHPDWDVVAMSYSAGVNYTIIVYRIVLP